MHTVYKTKDGERVPSVTTILHVLDKGNALMEWAWKCGVDGLDYKAVRDQSASIGTLAHSMILDHLTGTPGDNTGYSEQDIVVANEALKSYLEWEGKHKLKVIIAELPMISEQYRYGGTLDLFAELDGIPTLIDFKTTGGIYAEHFHQVSAYRQLLLEAGHAPKDFKILRISKQSDEKFEERTLSKLDLHFQIFLKCRELYELQKEAHRK